MYDPEFDDLDYLSHISCPYCSGNGILSQVKEEGEEIGDQCPLCEGTGKDEENAGLFILTGELSDDDLPF